MNKGAYPFSVRPGALTRVAPPAWLNHKAIRSTTSAEVVPQNVYQIGVAVLGAGASGAVSANDIATGGAGGAFAFAIVDVVPGQLLPTITVGQGGAAQTTLEANGNSGGTSSFGTLITATGGTGGVRQAAGAATLAGSSGGVATVSPTLRGIVTSNGGRSGSKLSASTSTNLNTGGGASGSFFGPGGHGGDIDSPDGFGTMVTGGGAWAEGHGGKCLSTVSAAVQYTGGAGFRTNGGDIGAGATTYTGGGGTASNGKTVVAGAGAGGNGILGDAGAASATTAATSATTGLTEPVSLIDILMDEGVFVGGGGGANSTAPYGDGALGGGSGACSGVSGDSGPGAGSGAANGGSSGASGVGGGTGAARGAGTSSGNAGLGGGTGAGSVASGKGGDGIVVLFWTEEVLA